MAFPVFGQTQVTVVGDVMLDHYWQGNTERISPEAPVPVVHVKDMVNRAGGAANVALNTAKLGCQTHLLGFIGQDDNGNSLTACLTENQIHNHLIPLTNYPTLTKHRILSQHQQLIRLDFEQPVAEEHFPLLCDRLQQALTQTDLLILSDYGKGTLLDPQTLIQMARKHNIPTLVDPKGNDFAKYRGATLITPNLKEFEQVVGPCASHEERVQRGLALRQQLDIDALLVTLGKDGMLLLTETAAPLHVPTKARDVFDVTGAGDTVIAVTGAALAAGLNYPEAIQLANTAASIVVAHVGTATVSADQLQHALSKTGSSEPKITTDSQLQAIVKQRQQAGETVVMTNGCFDILHAGHVEYLEKAKALGHRLIVAVNDDASVKRLKGETRPLNTVQERMRVLAALRCIDWVVPFSEDTPARLIGELLPNILVKGGDYQPADIAGGDAVTAHGGQVLTIPLRPNCSTTRLIRKIQTEEVV